MDKDLIERLKKLRRDIEKYDEIDNQTKIDAYNLYNELENKPNYRNSSSEIRAKVFNDRPIEEINEEFFSCRNRINFMLDWALELSPVLSLLQNKGNLPLNRTNDDFLEFMKLLLDDYLEELKQLPGEKIISSDEIIFISSLNNLIFKAIREYLSGDPALAFNHIDSALNELDANYKISELLTSNSDDNLRKSLFKMRIGDNKVYTSNDMFHIPFEKRGMVKTNRYSIPGLPCVYLGTSTFICWEEIGRPNLNSVQTSLYMPESNLVYLDISVPPQTFCDTQKFLFDMTYTRGKFFKDFSKYLVLWPLIASCSIRVKNSSDPFKPEYIIPQLVLQWVRRSSIYDGICYFSTKVNDYDSENISYFRNYALPVKEVKSKGYCEELRGKFELISDGLPWQFFQLYKGTQVRNSKDNIVHVNIELVKGLKIPYEKTDFYKLEQMLLDNYRNQKEERALT
ncbi:hypothetical protein P9F07_05835 [Bacillus subtilis]|uniref:hypothetical protein n=1 Tax=Bacillus subtilis TaxID=1423 RepID=UPI002DB7CABE|nr:hypothetical protein [Bacillus subtilis]MEC2134632.1 hypothetical protein [Bacillus subtilis]